MSALNLKLESGVQPEWVAYELPIPMTWYEKVIAAGVDAFTGFIVVLSGVYGNAIQNFIYWTLQSIYGPTDSRVVEYLWFSFFLILFSTIIFTLCVIRLRHKYLAETERKRLRREKRKQQMGTVLVGDGEGEEESETKEKEKEVLAIGNVQTLYDADENSLLQEDEDEEDILTSKVASPCGYWNKIVLEHHDVLIFSAWILVFSVYNYTNAIALDFYFVPGAWEKVMYGFLVVLSFGVSWAVSFIFHYQNKEKQNKRPKQLVYRLKTLLDKKNV